MAKSYLYRLEVRRGGYEEARAMLDRLEVLFGSTEFESTRPKRTIFEFVLSEECPRKTRKRIEETIIRESGRGEASLVRLPCALL